VVQRILGQLLTPSRTDIRTLSATHTHTHTPTHPHTLYLAHTPTLSYTHSHTPTLSYTQTHTLSLSYTLTHTVTHTPILSSTLTYSHTRTLIHILSTHTVTHPFKQRPHNVPHHALATVVRLSVRHSLTQRAASAQLHHHVGHTVVSRDGVEAWWLASKCRKRQDSSQYKYRSESEVREEVCEEV
jgi:hypothetical protein